MVEDGNKKLDVSKLEELVIKGGIFVWDTSGLNAQGFKKCIQMYFSVFQKNRNSFIVPSFVSKELNTNENFQAVIVLKNNLFYLMPDVSAYEDFFHFLKEHNIEKINMFVNDQKVKNAILSTGKATGVYVYFYMISNTGEIESFKTANYSQAPLKKNEKRENKQYQRDSKNTKVVFSIKSQPENVDFAPIYVESEMRAGAMFFTSRGEKHRLLKQEIVNNGAITYSTDMEGVWVKVFNRDSLNTYLQAKIERMLTQSMKYEGICWPLDIIKDEKGNFRGYTLNAYAGIPVHLCVFKRAGIDTYFSNWSKLDLCELTETLLNKIEYLHKKNILLGCINPAAIRVVSKREVYFTDTDNYQIDGFPSLVHNISFTAPELLDKKIYLATKANENFAIAELVFMLMMPGKTPYAVGGNEAPETLIKNMKFPYSNGQIHGNHALPSMWRFMWSHLGSLKGSFYNVFQNGAKYNKPEDRQDVFYWKNAVAFYKNGLLMSEDKESLKIYPQTFKKGKDEVFYKCNYCGIEHPRFYFHDKYFDDYRICNSCIEKKSEVSFTCQDCGKTYYYTNKTALFHKMMKKQDSEWKDQKHCRDCKKKTKTCISCGKEIPIYHLVSGRCYDCNKKHRESTYKWETCRVCGRPFEITYKDYEYFSQKRLNLPVRCQRCRELKKSMENTKGYVSPVNSNTSKKKSGIFDFFGF